MIGAACLIAPLAGNGLGRAQAGERLSSRPAPPAQRAVRSWRSAKAVASLRFFTSILV